MALIAIKVRDRNEAELLRCTILNQRGGSLLDPRQRFATNSASARYSYASA
jgi:uncharacterized C2H2 Zn-finger protein